MKVKTLVAAMMQEFDEAELYTDSMDLMSKMSPETLRDIYGDSKVKKFWIFVDEDGMTTLEVVLH